MNIRAVLKYFCSQCWEYASIGRFCHSSYFQLIPDYPMRARLGAVEASNLERGSTGLKDAVSLESVCVVTERMGHTGCTSEVDSESPEAISWMRSVIIPTGPRRGHPGYPPAGGGAGSKAIGGI